MAGEVSAAMLLSHQVTARVCGAVLGTWVYISAFVYRVFSFTVCAVVIAEFLFIFGQI